MKPIAIASSCLFGLFLIGISEAQADSIGQTWTLLKTSGQVQISGTNGAPVKARAGMHLRAPFDVATGDDGRVVVSRNGDRLSIGPNTRSTVERPTDTGSGVTTRIRQKQGSVLYHDEHRLKDSFEVDTPFLVSVVKGTTFNIHVTSDASTVVLLEGSLKVSMPDAQQGLMLAPGQAAIRSRDAHRITVEDQQSLSAPVRGPITVVKKGRAPARMRAEHVGAAGPVNGEILPAAAEHAHGIPMGGDFAGRGNARAAGSAVNAGRPEVSGLPTAAAVGVGAIVRPSVPAASANAAAGGAMGNGLGNMPAGTPAGAEGTTIPSIPKQLQLRLPQAQGRLP